MRALKTYLELTDTTQLAFAKRLNVEQATVSQWISGRHLPSAAKLRRISEETGISIDKLLAQPGTEAAA